MFLCEHFFDSHYELNKQAVIVCRLEYKNTYSFFLQATPLSSTELQCFLTFHQLSVKCCLGVT